MSKVLIIDDEIAIAQVFQQALEQAGYQVSIATSGKDGLSKATSEKPDLILVDQILPDMNGNEVVGTIKSNPANKTMPVAIISNFNHDGMVEEAMKNGASEYILKYQISPQDLVEKAKILLTGQKGSGWQDTNDEGI